MVHAPSPCQYWRTKRSPVKGAVKRSPIASPDCVRRYANMPGPQTLMLIAYRQLVMCTVS
ncbi:hypothetical protein HMPREF1978_00304 [Actinomyces graevenitzii F0530]|uniref:Uncharacterized protein n=1 Tax=Actinomyces graevenitzii F0530 TaxID=1321817 RepID=U1Q845_9ACTO|nr:hypothetical protein HMPREF1978_00304 [Actinomyces graevenitzii F0530]